MRGRGEGTEGRKKRRDTKGERPRIYRGETWEERQRKKDGGEAIEGYR